MANLSEKKSVFIDISIFIFFLVLPIIFFRNILFSKEMLIIGSPLGDLPNHAYQSRFFGFNLLKKGIIPLWCPNQKAGFPFIGSFQSAIFYPINLLFVIMPIHWAFNICYLLHMSLSGIFTYLFIKHITENKIAGVTSSIIYMFSSFQILHIFSGNINIICAMTWTPLVFLLIDIALKKNKIQWIIISGVILGIQILAGHIQYIFHLIIFISLYLFIMGHKYRLIRRLSYIFIFLTIGFSVSAIQILPAIETSANSVRTNMSYEFCGTYSLPPENLVTLLFPDFFGNDITVPYFGRCNLWETCIYLGIVTLILVAISIVYSRGIYKHTFLILSILSVILSLGRFTPLFKILYTYVPGFNLFRGNSKFFAHTTFFIAILAGFGMSFLSTKYEKLINKEKILRILFAIFLTTAIIYIIIFIVKNHEPIYLLWLMVLEKIYALGEKCQQLPPLSDLDFFLKTYFLAYMNIENTIAIFTICIGILILRLKAKISGIAFNIFLLLILLCDFWTFGSKFVVGFNKNICHWDIDIIRFLEKNNIGPYRVNYIDTIWNKGISDNLQIINGQEHATLKRFSELININEGFPLNHPQVFTIIYNPSKLMDLFNVKYYIVQKYMTSISHLKLVYSNTNYNIYENLNVLPHAFITHKAKILKTTDAIFKEMFNPKFNPQEEVILEEEPYINIEEDSKSDKVNILSYTPNRLSITAKLEKNGILVLCDNYFPGWEVYVDNKKDKILIANYCLRGVALNKGIHKLEFIYRPKPFIFGLIISAITFIGLIIYFIKAYLSNSSNSSI